MVTQTEPYTKEVVVLTASLHNPTKSIHIGLRLQEMSWRGPVYSLFWVDLVFQVKQGKKGKAKEQS